jgi:hypothetical protein
MTGGAGSVQAGDGNEKWQMFTESAENSAFRQTLLPF